MPGFILHPSYLTQMALTNNTRFPSLQDPTSHLSLSLKRAISFSLWISEYREWALLPEVEAVIDLKLATASEEGNGSFYTAGFADVVVHLDFKANKPRSTRQEDSTIASDRMSN